MRRDIVFEKLIELSKNYNDGITASNIAEELSLNRANVSSDLNKLVVEGKVIKTNGKPKLFKPVEKYIKDAQNIHESNYEETKSLESKGNDKVKEKSINRIGLKEITENHLSILDKFLEVNPSLSDAVEQAKAAILYPKNGMNILLIGDTGVGKSTFAEIIYKYTLEMKIKSKNSPFITFNCSDYANNPQLLLGQMFGVKKGSYTGADADRVGLLEKANGGILFLDEVHRLPAEGQEMFFTFIDKGVYRRLGETESERRANVFIITATTENPDTALLRTFKRRIPVVIKIPCLKERGVEERFNLIKKFLIEESKILKKDIKISINSIKAFLYYDCENNIGQLKSDIQFTCAKAYANFLSNKKDDIKINSVDLPSSIKEGIYNDVEHRQLWSKLIDINKKYCVFDEKIEDLIFEGNNNDNNIYEMLDYRIRELKRNGIEGIKLEEEMEKDIEDYFKTYISKVNIANISNVIENDIMIVIEKVISFCEEQLEKKLDKKIHYGLAIHINNSIYRIKNNRRIMNPKLNFIRKEYTKEFEVALKALRILESELDINIPIDEAGFITMFLAYDNRGEQNNVCIIVIAHGVATATAITDTVNNLLGSTYAVGINAPIQEKPKNILEKTKEYIRKNDIKTDILFLVDMGSLTTFGKEIEREFNIKTKTIPLVSTLHVIEATRKAILGYSLEEIYIETLEVNQLYDNNELEHKIIKTKEKKLAIITVCTTGEGGAKSIKEFMENSLDIDSNIIDIVPIDFNLKEDINEKIEEINKKYEIICFVGPFELNTNHTQFKLDELLEGTCIQEIQKLINNEKTYIKMGETLKNQLKNIDGNIVLKDIKKFNNNVIRELKVKINTNILIGVTFHMACLIDRLKAGGKTEEYKGKEEYIKEKANLYQVLKNACKCLNTKYSIVIGDDDTCRLMDFFHLNQKK